ncbi:MAG TPA: hypothetical protein VNW71_01055 [Thermoanaerobaculia bacterium]|nr:hypothetical protein [Thermoanaerobaculia bacterium]
MGAAQGATAEPTLARLVEAVREKALVVPSPLFDFFLSQMDKYGGASDATLQRLRYLRDAVFRKQLTRAQAAAAALAILPGSPEDGAALRHFARDMK